ncbi:MAG: hypothetical protein IKT73_06575 [Anaerotignum sp.]|nr:hypothetical protein [Anaerotignum sp.]MBR6542853.1 hypothetical protein [Anaerotignum sp.]
MFGRKTGFLAAMMVALMLFGGCSAADETQAKNWYNEMTKDKTFTDKTADGYGNYTGGPNWGEDPTDRTTYGMRTDTKENTLGQDIRNAWDNVKNDVKDMGNMK